MTVIRYSAVTKIDLLFDRNVSFHGNTLLKRIKMKQKLMFR